MTWKKERVPGLPAVGSTAWLRPLGQAPEGTFEAEQEQVLALFAEALDAVRAAGNFGTPAGCVGVTCVA